MSYILDALRRAESERARGQVPGLHDQPALPATAAARSAWPAWAWALPAGAILLLLAVAALWWLWPKPVARPAIAVAPGAVAAPPTAVPTPVPAPVPAPTQAAAAARPPPMPATTPLLPQVVSAPAPVVPAAAAVPAAAPTTAAPIAPAAAAAAVAAAAAQPAAVIKLADLPADQRRAWPNPALSGSVWSESAASRFVIVNGLLLHEGEAAAPGLIVERIGPKSVVMRWRDKRVEVPL